MGAAKEFMPAMAVSDTAGAEGLAAKHVGEIHHLDEAHAPVS
jgi:hypothetical protein